MLCQSSEPSVCWLVNSTPPPHLTLSAVPCPTPRYCLCRAPGIPPDAMDVARACLSPDPALRPTCEQLTHFPYFQDISRISPPTPITRVRPPAHAAKAGQPPASSPLIQPHPLFLPSASSFSFRPLCVSPRALPPPLPSPAAADGSFTNLGAGVGGLGLEVEFSDSALSYLDSSSVSTEEDMPLSPAEPLSPEGGGKGSLGGGPLRVSQGGGLTGPHRVCSVEDEGDAHHPQPPPPLALSPVGVPPDTAPLLLQLLEVPSGAPPSPSMSVLANAASPKAASSPKVGLPKAEKPSRHTVNVEGAGHGAHGDGAPGRGVVQRSLSQTDKQHLSPFAVKVGWRLGRRWCSY